MTPEEQTNKIKDLINRHEQTVKDNEKAILAMKTQNKEIKKELKQLELKLKQLLH